LQFIAYLIAVTGLVFVNRVELEARFQRALGQVLASDHPNAAKLKPVLLLWGQQIVVCDLPIPRDIGGPIEVPAHDGIGDFQFGWAPIWSLPTHRKIDGSGWNGGWRENPEIVELRYAMFVITKIRSLSAIDQQRLKFSMHVNGWPSSHGSYVERLDNHPIRSNRFLARVSRIKVWMNPRAILPFEISDSSIRRALGSFGGFSRFPRLPSVDTENTESDQDSPYLKRFFPRWCAIFAPFGAIVLGWGWWNLRDNRRLPWSAISFCVGCIFWIYGFTRLVSL
jgi:hypothetical protein